MRKKIGPFEINVWGGGYPVRCFLAYNFTSDIKREFELSHGELRDLKYAVDCLMREARAKLPDMYKDEV